ncbi:MAG: hypothetical protein FJY29_13795 [Betaproteobacteria bacterium]|nr:hypothetical protein [Betaproteobacteria bacterium]
MLNLNTYVVAPVLLSLLFFLNLNANADLAFDTEAPAVAIKTNFDLPKGRFSLDSRWTTVQQTADEIDVLAGRVSFLPKQRSSKEKCGAISFIQTARVLNNRGQDFEWPQGQHARNAMRTTTRGQKILPGYFIDHDAVLCKEGHQGCSPFFRDSWPNSEDGSQDGSILDGRSHAAVLVDYPFGWEVISSISLEACAVCRDSGEYLGCASWGGTWPPVGERFVHTPVFSEQPSATFVNALERFKNYYSRAR